MNEGKTRTSMTMMNVLITGSYDDAYFKSKTGCNNIKLLGNLMGELLEQF